MSDSQPAMAGTRLSPPGGPGEHLRVVFKHESEIAGEPVGPVNLLDPATYGGGADDPEAPKPIWYTLTEATDYAEFLGLPLVEVRPAPPT